MLSAVSGINVWSDMNPWIDFVIIPKDDFEKAEKIISFLRYSKATVIM